MTDELPAWFVLVKERFDRQDRILERVETQVTATNSRTTANEVAIAVLNAAANSRAKFAKQFWLACSASAGLGLLIVGLINILH